MIQKNLFIICFLLLVSFCTALTEQEKISIFYKNKGGAVRTDKNGISVLHLTDMKNIKDEDIKYIQMLENLTILTLEGTSVSSDGLIYVKNLKLLEGLFLRDTKIDDSGMKFLKGLESLQELDLVNTKVTDEGIQELAGLENLRMLKLRGTKVTQKGIDKLQKKLPDCYITLETDEEIQ